jgi:hypothetical protein
LDLQQGMSTIGGVISIWNNTVVAQQKGNESIYLVGS